MRARVGITLSAKHASNCAGTYYNCLHTSVRSNQSQSGNLAEHQIVGPSAKPPLCQQILLQFIYCVNSHGSKTAKIIKR